MLFSHSGAERGPDGTSSSSPSGFVRGGGSTCAGLVIGGFLVLVDNGWLFDFELFGQGFVSLGFRELGIGECAFFGGGGRAHGHFPHGNRSDRNSGALG